ncbi:hypothetical protein FACS1894125_2900 [Actinomycetota bacterium]|nr:hypothetical protein FACS1894125_2900 [Actinomycetota bacterium]
MTIAITLFIFALLLGIAVIGRVPATLHTPLMSGANSIHGVVLVGVIIVAAQSNSVLGNLIVFFAALLGTLNVVGGYVVTDRMLEMFKPKRETTALEEDLNTQIDDDGAIALDITEKRVVEVPIEESLKEDPLLAKSVVIEDGKDKGATV